jgi:hypothetical protein
MLLFPPVMADSFGRTPSIFCRPRVGEICRDVATANQFRDAARTRWHALTRGDQRRRVRTPLQALSLATTEPKTYGPYARAAVEVMVDPISDAFVSLGYRCRRVPRGSWITAHRCVYR